jgi:DNA-binding XRE family transcriptional regulator
MHLRHSIAARRKELGWTQQMLAERLGWNLRKLTSYERNERIPPLPEAIEIAEALGTTVDKIWTLKKDGN